MYLTQFSGIHTENLECIEVILWYHCWYLYQYLDQFPWEMIYRDQNKFYSRTIGHFILRVFVNWNQPQMAIWKPACKMIVQVNIVILLFTIFSNSKSCNVKGLINFTGSTYLFVWWRDCGLKSWTPCFKDCDLYLLNFVMLGKTGKKRKRDSTDVENLCELFQVCSILR